MYESPLGGKGEGERRRLPPLRSAKEFTHQLPSIFRAKLIAQAHHRRGSALFERMDPPFRLLELRHTRCADCGILSLLLLLLQLSHRRSRLEASEATDFFRTTSQVAALRVGDSTACMQYSFSVRCRACPISSFFLVANRVRSGC